MEAESPRLRLSILGIVVFSLFAALFARLWYLQIMATDQGEVEAAANRVRVIQEEAPRGRILDAKGRVLVDNRTSLVVTIDPHDLSAMKKDARDDMLLRLATELTSSGIPTKVSTIERRLNDPRYSPLQPIPVAIDVPEDLMVYLAERADDFPSVQVARETVRAYPEGTLAAHVVGYVGRISPDELDERMGTKDEPKHPPKPYEPSSDIGKTGIESTFEDDLRGLPGQHVVEVDSKGKVVRELVDQRQNPVPGNDVQLTIDIDTQRTTETRLAEQLETLRGTYTNDYKLVKANAGSAVVLDPRNGNVVAMASYPTYDPAEFVNGISTDRYEQLTGGDASDNPLTNRAIAGLYAPGSTFKLVTAYAGLSTGMIDGTTGYQDNGVYTVGPQKFQNAEGYAHGWVPLPRAITVSSDVYFYWLGDRFWAERDKYGDAIQTTARQFGFGKPTGIQLPGELGGVVPDPAWKKAFWEQLPEDARGRDGDKWYTGDNIILAIGQGDMLATPLQMAQSYSVFAERGTEYQPNLVLRVLKPGSDPNDPASVVRTIEPVVTNRFDMPAAFADPLQQGFNGVTKDTDGTATAAFEGFDQQAFPVYGKTGTAEVKGKADNSLFVGVGPTTDPKYVTVAVLEQSGFGADAAGPVVRSIFEQVSGQDVPPDPCAPPDPTKPSTTTTTRPSTTTTTCPPGTGTSTNGTSASGSTNGTSGTGAAAGTGGSGGVTTTTWYPQTTSTTWRSATTSPATTPRSTTPSTYAPATTASTPRTTIAPTSNAPPTSPATSPTTAPVTTSAPPPTTPSSTAPKGGGP